MIKIKIITKRNVRIAKVGLRLSWLFFVRFFMFVRKGFIADVFYKYIGNSYSKIVATVYSFLFELEMTAHQATPCFCLGFLS